MRPFARHYRPNSLITLTGMHEYKHILSNTLKLKLLSSAYLLTGTRGIGKTTLARIAAYLFSCNEIQFLNSIATQCNKCHSCTNNHPDILEIDGASHNSVEDVKTIIDIAMQFPLYAKHKVIIIDEVHMFSNAAFNAMLKLLEEPPKHTIFFLATTEEHKIPKTVISRCQKFEILAYSKSELEEILINICKKENITYSSKTIDYIIETSDSSVREAINNLDKLSILYNNNLDNSEITNYYISENEVTSLVDAILKKDHNFIHSFLQKTKYILNEKLFYTKMIKAIYNSKIVHPNLSHKCYDIINSHLTTYSNLIEINVFALIQKLLLQIHNEAHIPQISKEESKIPETHPIVQKPTIEQNLLIDILEEPNHELNLKQQFNFLKALNLANSLVFHLVIQNCEIYDIKNNTVFLYTKLKPSDLLSQLKPHLTQYEVNASFKPSIKPIINSLEENNDVVTKVKQFLDVELVNVKFK